jgi:hypothetical protein
MATSYTTFLGLALPVTGELSGTWGDTVNNYISNYIDAAIAGAQTVTTDTTLTKTTGSSLGSTSSQYAIIIASPASANITITAPAASKIYTIINTSATYTVKIVGAGPTTGVTLGVSEKAQVAWNGSDFVRIGASGGPGVFSSITNTGLTSGRVVYSTTGGLETDSANLLFNGTTLTANTLNLTNALGTTYGGTGLSSFTSGGVVYASSSSVLATGSALTFDGSSFNVAFANGTNPRIGARFNSSNARIGFGVANSNGFAYLGYNVNDVVGSDGQTYDLSGQGVAQMRMDNGTFIWNRADAGTAGAGVSWAEQMRLTTTGLGIGTSSPGAKLHVSTGTTTNALAGNAVAGFTSSANAVLSFNVPDANAAGLFFGYGGNAYWAGIEKNGSTGLRVVSGGIVTFDAGGAERMRLDSSGNLGLGVTPSAWGIGSGGHAFELSNGGAFWNYSNSSGVNFSLNTYYNGAYYYKNTAAATMYTQGLGQHQWFTAPSGTAGNAITFTQAMTLDASGKLLVGTTTAASGTSIQVSVVSSGGGGLQFGTASGGGGALIANPSGGIQFYGYTGAQGFESYSERARIDSSGNLGLGVTPSAWFSSYAAFQFGGTGSLFGSTSGGFDFLTSNAFVGSGDTFRYIATGVASTAYRFNSGDGTHKWYNAPSGTAGNAITFTQAMTLDASGNLLVGTTSASGTLSVNGAIANVGANSSLSFSGTSTIINASASAAAAGTHGSSLVFAQSWSSGSPSSTIATGQITGVKIANDGTFGGGLAFWTSNGAGNDLSERMRLNSLGNLGVGTTAPNASAILDVQSTTKGVRMPNMTTTQKNAISSPAAGLMVFDTTLAKLCVYSGSAWQTITSV